MFLLEKYESNFNEIYWSIFINVMHLEKWYLHFVTPLQGVASPAKRGGMCTLSNALLGSWSTPIHLHSNWTTTHLDLCSSLPYLFLCTYTYFSSEECIRTLMNVRNRISMHTTVIGINAIWACFVYRAYFFAVKWFVYLYFSM